MSNKLREKYYKKQEDHTSCEYYRKRIIEIIYDIKTDNDPPVSLVRNIACAKDCKGDSKPFHELSDHMLNLAGAELMIQNLTASGYTTYGLKKIVKKNADELLNVLK